MQMNTVTVTDWSLKTAKAGSPNCLDNIIRKDLKDNYGIADPTPEQIYGKRDEYANNNNAYVDEYRLQHGGKKNDQWKEGMPLNQRVVGGNYPDGGQYIDPNKGSPDPGKRYVVLDGPGPNGKPFVVYVNPKDGTQTGAEPQGVDPKTGDPSFPGLKAKTQTDPNKYETSAAGTEYDKFKKEVDPKNKDASKQLVDFCTKIPGWDKMSADQQAAVIKKYREVGIDENNGQQKTAAVGDFGGFLNNVKPGDFKDPKFFNAAVTNYPNGADKAKVDQYTNFIKTDYYKNSNQPELLAAAAAKDPANAMTIAGINDGKIPPGAKLYPGQYVFSADGKTFITMTAEGNLELHQQGGDGKYVKKWESETGKGGAKAQGGQGAYAIFEDGGNFVVFSNQNDDKGNPKLLFETGTREKGSTLTIENGDFKVRKPDGAEIWDKSKGGKSH